MNSEKKPYGGFGELVDFAHGHSLKGKLKNIAFVFVVDLLWTICVSVFLMGMLGMKLKAIASLLLASPFPAQALGDVSPGMLLGSEMNDSPAAVLATGPGKILFLVFLICVVAPLTEEVLFRVLPIQLGQILTEAGKALGLEKCKRFTFWVCIGISGIVFGWMHGSPLNILYQGMGGALLAWLYVKNNNSYWSSVAAHFLWNFMLLIGLPIILAFSI